MNLTYKNSDGGLSSTGISEYNDCTVRAFANVADIPYKVAHEACVKFGRKPRRRFRNFEGAVPHIARHLGLDARLVRKSGTLARLVRDFPVGRLVVRMSGHAFAVVNGAVLDTLRPGPRVRVKQAWEITNTQIEAARAPLCHACKDDYNRQPHCPVCGGPGTPWLI